MDLESIKFAFKNHKNQILIGLGTGIIIATILAITLNSTSNQLLKGDTSGGGGDGSNSANANVCTTEPYTTFNKLLKSINAQIEALNDITEEGINIESTDATLSDGLISKIDTLLLAVASIVPTAETTYTNNNCFEVLADTAATTSIATITNLSAKVESINQTIEAFNNARVECQKQLPTTPASDETSTACDAVELTDLTFGADKFGCNPGRIYDKETDSCQDSAPTVCEYNDLYQIIVEANDLLDDFADDPEDFSRSDNDDLQDLLDEIADSLDTNSAAVLSGFSRFDYTEDAEDLSELLAAIVAQIIESDSLCDDLDEIDVIDVNLPRSTPNNDDEAPNNRNNNENPVNNSCPRYASYDDFLESCICDSTDELVTKTGSCPAYSNDDEAGIDDEFICEDGTSVESISECVDDLTNPEEEFDFSKLPAGTEENSENNDSNLDEEDNENLINDAISQLGENQSNNQETVEVEEVAVIQNPQTLNSNTNANVMQTGIIQGDTGPAAAISILFALLVSSLVYVGIIKKAN